MSCVFNLYKNRSVKTTNGVCARGYVQVSEKSMDELCVGFGFNDLFQSPRSQKKMLWLPLKNSRFWRFVPKNVHWFALWQPCLPPTPRPSLAHHVMSFESDLPRLLKMSTLDVSNIISWRLGWYDSRTTAAPMFSHPTLISLLDLMCY